MMDFIEEHTSHILFIPSIFIEDCLVSQVDDEFDESYSESNNTSDDSDFDDISCYDHNEKLDITDLQEDDNIIYEQVPKFFINKEHWINTTNLKCAYCHENITGIPFPIALNLCKILVPDNNTNSDIFVDLQVGKNNDDMLFNCQLQNEVKAYKLHNILFSDIVCAGNYIRKIHDSKILNKVESLKLTINIYAEITGDTIDDIPEKDLWIVMKQYCGDSGISQNDYKKKNNGNELNLKFALTI